MKKTEYGIVKGKPCSMQVRNGICYRLVSRENYESVLEQMPHEEFLDLVVLYQYVIPEDSGERRAALLNWEQLTAFGIREEELRRIAERNTPRLFPPRLCRMEQFLRQLGREENTEESAMQPVDPYVYTTEGGRFGATCLLYGDALWKASKELGGSYYILPSSLHELIFLPDTKETEAEQLAALVREVNRTQVAKEDRLSDHVYFYDAAVRRVKRIL